ALSSCNGSSGGSTGPGTPPAAPLAFDGFYYARAVHLSWELGPTWSGESFRIYAKRTTDPNYLPIAEVTNCAGGVCSYRDINILSNVTYQYYVAAVGSGGAETSSANSIQIP